MEVARLIYKLLHYSQLRTGLSLSLERTDVVGP